MTQAFVSRGTAEDGPDNPSEAGQTAQGRFGSCLCLLGWARNRGTGPAAGGKELCTWPVCSPAGGSRLWGVMPKEEPRSCRELRVAALGLRFRSNLGLKHRIMVELKD